MVSWVLTEPQRRKLTPPSVHVSNSHRGGAGAGGILGRAFTFLARVRWFFKIVSSCPNADGIRITKRGSH